MTTMQFLFISLSFLSFIIMINPYGSIGSAIAIVRVHCTSNNSGRVCQIAFTRDSPARRRCYGAVEPGGRFGSLPCDAVGSVYGNESVVMTRRSK